MIAVLATGCVWTSDGGFTKRHVSDWEAETASPVGSWNGEPITVINDSGDVRIVGVEGQHHITLRARFVAGANDDSDAEAAFADVADGLRIELRDGAWIVDCPEASETHRTAVPSATGCDRMIVEVPAATAVEPLDLRGVARGGGIHARGVVVSHLDLRAPFGVVADIVPADGASIDLYGEDLVSGYCSTWLRTPSGTGFSEASFVVEHADVRYAGASADDPELWLGARIDGFADAPAIPVRTASYTWMRDADGGSPSGVQARLRASLGRAALTTLAVPSSDDTVLCASLELSIDGDIED